MSSLANSTEPDPDLRNSETTENAFAVVWKLAWPAVALNSLQVINSVLDSGFVGHLKANAAIAYGAATTMIFTLFSLIMSFGTASTALCSRAYGAGDVTEYRRAARENLKTTSVFCFGLALVAYLVAPLVAQIFVPNANLLKGDEVGAHQLLVDYLRCYSFGLPAFGIIQALAGALRGIGDTKSPMVISGIQIFLHIMLNYMFIFDGFTFGTLTIRGANLGLLGAGASIVISGWIAAIAYLLYTPYTKLGACYQFGIPNSSWAKRILNIAMPNAMMALLRTASFGTFTILVKNLAEGAVAVAAMRPAFAIESAMFMPAFGISVAAASLVGQSLGMERPDRAEKLGWTAAHLGAVVTLICVLPIFIFADPIVKLMVDDKPEIAAQAVLLLRSLCVTEAFFSYALVFIGALQGAGDTRRPVWVTIISLWGIRLPLAYLLAYTFRMGSLGAWIAMSFSQMIQGVHATILFKQGKWKTTKV